MIVLPSCMCMVCVHFVCGGQKRTSDLELELWAALATMLVLGTEHGSSARAPSALNAKPSLWIQALKLLLSSSLKFGQNVTVIFK